MPDSRRPFRPVDLLKQVMIQELALSPDGEIVVYSRRTIEKNKYRKRLWRVGYRGGRPVQLTTAEASDGRPRISPDGNTLLFVSDRSGRAQPWVMPFHGGEPRQLAEFAGDVRAAEWSPDGKRVLLLAPSGEERFLVGKADDPVARRIRDYTWRLDGVGIRDQFTSGWVVGAGGGKPRRITEPTYEVFDAFWAPDSRSIGFLADLRPDAALEEYPQAWSVPASGGKPTQVATLMGMIGGARFGPSGALAFVGIEEPGSPEWANMELFVHAGGKLQQLGGSLDLPIWNTTYGDLVDPEAFLPPALAWLDDSNVVALVSHRGASHPYRFGLDGSVERLAGGDTVCSSLATGGGRVAVVASDRGRPGEICAVEDGRLRPMTSNGSRWMAPFRRDPERIAISHPDGHEIDAWLLTAHGRRRRGPMVLHIHGGPHLSHGPTPWLEMLALADAGIHVLLPNPRGSAGYGEKFTRAIDQGWGEADGSDLLHLVDWAIADGLADRARVGIMGLSYGGFMTNWMLAHHPGRFATAVSENPVTDALGMLASSDAGRWLGRATTGSPLPTENVDRWLAASSFLGIHANESPLLLLQSENDLRCPPGQSEIIFTILRSLGRTVEMVRYPGESHILVLAGRPDRRVDRIDRIVDWLATHLRARRS